jgi:uncharacterized lipoprotein YmbA
MRTRHALSLLLAALVVGALCGCVNFKPVEDTTRFYVLTAQASRESSPDKGRLTNLVFVSEVEIPAYLDNPRIAVRRDEPLIEYSDRRHWAEPLHDGVRRSLRDNLAAILGSQSVFLLSHRRPAGDVIEVQVSLSRFEVTFDQSARVIADWRLVRTKSGEVLASRHTDQRREYQDTPFDFSPAVTALGHTLADLSSQIALALKQKPRVNETEGR